ncbi:hypothetical protein AVEN_81592-1 [Araneus ventricosus]|uniref:Uncharacterized protein n=1 Tax=Araneus ventricosus TaxID=182803 RepID=A0A4Y2FNJ7_ARAVE|nr:hypothetical protein AVEN_81592-1 [Araneus ventricosus]
MAKAFANKLPQGSFILHYSDNLGTIPVVIDCGECVAVPEQELSMKNLLNQDGVWMKNNPQVWDENLRFKEIKTFIKNLKVVNDTDERGAKLMEDFSQSITKLTKNEEQTQNLLQTVKERLPSKMCRHYVRKSDSGNASSEAMKAAILEVKL